MMRIDSLLLSTDTIGYIIFMQNYNTNPKSSRPDR